MNTEKITQVKTQAWRQMADEHVALELLEAHARITSLEDDVRVYREIAQQGIHALALVTSARDRLQVTVREQRELLRRYDEAYTPAA